LIKKNILKSDKEKIKDLEKKVIEILEKSEN
jgi:hypothetical protein